MISKADMKLSKQLLKYLNCLQKLLNYKRFRVREVNCFKSTRPFPKEADPSSPI